MSNQLLAYFDFDQGPSRSVSDASGKGRNGAVTDASTSKWPASSLAGGRYAKIFSSRREDVVRVSSNKVGMPTGNAARTVSYWFKDASGNSAAFGMGCRRQGQGWNMYMKNSGKTLHLDFYGSVCEWGRTVNNDCNDWANVSPRSGWNHVVVTYDGTYLVGYFNGEQKARSDPPSNPNTCSTSDSYYSFNVGAGAWSTDGSSQPFRGQLDEVAVWGRALSKAEVATLWRDGQGLSLIAGTRGDATLGWHYQRETLIAIYMHANAIMMLPPSLTAFPPSNLSTQVALPRAVCVLLGNSPLRVL